MDGIAHNFASPHFHNVCRTRNGDFIDTFCPVHHKSMFQPESAQRFRHQIHNLRRKHTDNLKLSSGRICQRPKNIEDGSNPDLLAHGPNMFHRGVKALSKKKTDADVGYRPPELFDRHVNVETQRFNDIRASAPAGHGSIAMLGDANTCTRSNERGRSRNVESAGAVTACPAGVENIQSVAGPEWLSLFTHHPGKGDKLFRSLTFHVQGNQESANLRFTDLPFHDLLHGSPCFRLRQIPAVCELLNGRLNHRLKKFRKMVLPSVVMIDSG